MKKNIYLSCLIGLLLPFGMLLLAPEARAEATASISAVPSKTSIEAGKAFTIVVKVSGGGQKFTSFGANISTTNLSITSLTKGNVTQWISEPTSRQLSFLGAVGGETDSVSVYTVTAKGIKEGNATFSISGGTVNKTDGFDVTEILGSQKSASIEIKAPAAATVVPVTGTDTGTQVTEKPKPTEPQLSNEESSLEKEWRQYGLNNFIDFGVGVDPNNSKVSNGNLSGVRFNGIATPNSLITLFVFSTRIVKSTTSDKDGRWEIILTEELEAGDHKAYATINDGENVTRSANVLSFVVDPEKKIAKEDITDLGLIAKTGGEPQIVTVEKSNWFVKYITLGTDNPWVGLMVFIFALLIGYTVIYKITKIERDSSKFIISDSTTPKN